MYNKTRLKKFTLTHSVTDDVENELEVLALAFDLNYLSEANSTIADADIADMVFAEIVHLRATVASLLAGLTRYDPNLSTLEREAIVRSLIENDAFTSSRAFEQRLREDPQMHEDLSGLIDKLRSAIEEKNEQSETRQAVH